MPTLPSPDHWNLITTGDSRVPVLRRRWTPGPSRPFPPATNRWTFVTDDGSVKPLLERHWASAVWSKSPALPDGEHISISKTVTGVDRRLAPYDGVVGLIRQTVTSIGKGSSAETVTRVCEGCGKPLEGKRRQAKCHGAACRQRAYRRRRDARERLGRREDSVEPVRSLSA